MDVHTLTLVCEVYICISISSTTFKKTSTCDVNLLSVPHTIIFNVVKYQQEFSLAKNKTYIEKNRSIIFTEVITFSNVRLLNLIGPAFSNQV